jgi:hypothetical protein
LAIATTNWECGALDFALAYDTDDTTTLSRRRDPERFTSQRFVDSNDGYESDPELFHRNGNWGRPCSTLVNHRHEFPETSTTLQEFLNERCTFICHSPTVPNDKSAAVHVWIERGYQLYDSLVLPKLCWKPILSPSVNSDNVNQQHRTNMVGGVVSSMELLEICRICPMDTPDREKYPFAVTQRLFSIQTYKKNDTPDSSHNMYAGPFSPATSIVLEARSIADRIRYTNLLKLTVSTLAAKYLTNDPSTFPLFFHNANLSDVVD